MGSAFKDLVHSSIKASIKQTRIKKPGKYPYNKKQRSGYKFWNPASRSAPTRSSNKNQSIMGWQWGHGPWKRSPYVHVSDVLCYKPIPIIHLVI